MFQSRCCHSCAVCHPCRGWRQAREGHGRNALSSQSPLWLQMGGPNAHPVPSLPAPARPRSIPHILFWSVGDLFTYRSRFLLPINFIFVGIEEERSDVCLAPHPRSSGGEGEARGVFEYLSQPCPVCVLERVRAVKGKVLFKLAQNVSSWPVSCTSEPGTPPSSPHGLKRGGAHTATLWLLDPTAPLFPPDGFRAPDKVVQLQPSLDTKRMGWVREA